VLVGKVDRIRPVNLRAVFVIGAVEGEFPAQLGPTGIFSDAERQQLIDAGTGVTAPTLTRMALESFFAYFATTLASEYLSISWPGADRNGQELLPSSIVGGLMGMFPDIILKPLSGKQMLTGEKPAFRLLAAEYGSGSVMESSLLSYFGGGERANTLNRMEKARRHADYHITDRGLARELFGGNLRISPTRVERYYSCPFRYFAADGLALRQRRKVEFTPLESGSVIHNVLQVMVQRHGGKGLAAIEETTLEQEIASVIQDYLSALVDDVTKLPVRFQYLFGRLTGMLSRLLRRIGEEFAQSEFSPAAFELPIRQEEGVEPLHLQTIDGVSVAVEGVVDRVDIMEKNGVRYVRVVDYKSGAKTFDLHDILYGLNMQMLLYLFTIGENGKSELADAIPAGVLYMPVNESFVSAGRYASTEQVAKEQKKQWRMSGILLEDEEVLRGMERDLAGVYIPVKQGEDGFDRYSSLATSEEMGRLSRKVKELVAQMAEALGDGAVAALPVNSEGYKTCEYCEFRAVCGHEPGDPIREIAKMDRAAVLKLLEEKDDG
jgi:ATP-dependent helicase/nuclease subunit B